MGKNIVFCADGTWNGPGQDENNDDQPDPTNVYKLFLGLTGVFDTKSLKQADEQEKQFVEAGRVVQVAKYIHGVGDSRNPITRLIGGTFGSGIIARIVRGYTYISRQYEPGDNIVIVGFSRGAYTARALAGMIASQGLLIKTLTTDKESAYRAGAKVWYRYRQQAASHKAGFLEKLAEATAGFSAFLSRDKIKDDQLIAVEKILSVAVWDTVGAMGLPNYVKDERADTFKFTNTDLSMKVVHGFHAVALDERRMDFTPTLWDAREGVTQVAFSGAHADVGGGYTTNNNESGLSDIALEWMVGCLKGIGVHFKSPIYVPVKSDARGVAHQPWHYPPFNIIGETAVRNLKGFGVEEHPSILERINAGSVVAEPKQAASIYQPLNRLL